MATNGSTNDYFEIDPGVSHTVLAKASVNFSKCKQRSISHTCLERNVCSRGKNEIAGHFKNSSTVPKFHIPHVSGTEGGRISPPHFQSQSSELLRHDRTLSFDKHVSRPRLSTTPRLALQDRPFPSVLPSESHEVTEALSSPNIQSRTVRDDLLTVRSEHGSQNFFNPIELGRPNVARQVERQDISIPGRLFDRTSGYRDTSGTCSTNSTYITDVRMGNKFREVSSPASKEYNIPRYSMGTLGKSQIVATGKDCFHETKDQSCSRSRHSKHKRRPENSGVTELRQFCRTTGSSKSSTLNNVPKYHTAQLDKNLHTNCRCHRRTKVVDTELPNVVSIASTTSGKLPDHGCLGRGLGRPTKPPSPIGNLVSSGPKVALQPKRDACNSVCPSESSPHNFRQVVINSMRQQNRSRSFKERGRHQITTSNGIDLSNPELARPLPDSVQHTLSTRQIQQQCRQSVATQTTPGVASFASVCADNIFKMGNSSDRPVRLSHRARSLQLCNSRSYRSPSPSSRCVQRDLALPACVDFPTTVLDPKSTDAPESLNRSILNSCTPVGESVLASRSKSQSPICPNDSEEPTETPSRHLDRPRSPASRRDCSRGVEMWGWSQAIESWNTDQISLLKDSWRQSTLKTYQIAWKRWVTWCSRKQLDAKNPTGSELAQFLSDLYLVNRLSYNTILLHKSVVSTLCNTEISSVLSSHVLVKHVLKSIALKNPKVNNKSPIWDVSKLISFISNYAIDQNNTFQVSRHTAILLLLCSGRRIHDLTLLAVDLDHYVKSDQFVIFWPQFGSKTDNSNYSQSGWKLLVNENNLNLNPPFWIDRTITLLHERREVSGTDNLFITVRGVAKPASRTVIAGWVKTIFKEADIEASPGSVRSAVASKSWFENQHIDDILARGNWRSANTFRKFYRREIRMNCNNQSSSVTRLFNPIDS